MATQLRKRLGKRVEENVPLAPFTTFGIGGQALFFIAAKKREEIIEAVKTSRELSLPYFVLGGGSNILVSDQGFPGLVIQIKNKGLRVEREKIIAEAGTPLAKIVETARKNSLTGLECCIGIPGTLGGAICGNAGAREEWIGQKVAKVSIIDKESKIRTLNNASCQFSYRQSRFKNESQEIVLNAVLILKEESPKIIEEKIKLFSEARKNQPKEKSAGSVFKNPEGDSAGRLIEEAGLKGKRAGGAQISEKHANFIINTGGAKAEDVLKLIRLAQTTVKEKFNINLELEIRLVGF
ncbi:UDP-N-acetylmuramate dehydrogenase [Candidatus Shapirobacteria bacterium]|nr:UDP-N-acetylmuramate dehydrogenase [Candidatus Shapirobacteria bacterium]